MMRKIQWLAVLAMVPAIVVLAPEAHADNVAFTLTQNTCSGGCAPGPFGTVDVTTAGEPANTVLVTDTLLNGADFVNTGSGYALAFSIAGDPTISIGSLTSGFSVGNELTGQTESRDGAGVYDYWIVCSSCGSGGSNPQPGPLSFTITAAGITPEAFEVSNNKGYYLASDIIAGNGNTGNAEANGFVVSAAEPGTIVLLGMSLLGLLVVRRKQIDA
jgi:hypothetical protein